jgi:hypothetical protein
MGRRPDAVLIDELAHACRQGTQTLGRPSGMTAPISVVTTWPPNAEGS